MKKTQKVRSPDPVDLEVGRRLRQQRLHVGMPQERLGDILGITFQQVQKYEMGRNRIASGRLLAAAEALGVSVGYFYDDLQAGKGAKASSGGAADVLARMLATPHGVRLASAFLAIDDADVRRQIIAIAETIADARAQTTQTPAAAPVRRKRETADQRAAA